MTTPSVTQPQIVSQFFNESHFEGTIEELLSALEPSQRSPLSVERQAEVFALLWELDGHLRMLRKLVSEGHTIRSTRSIRLAQRAVSDLFGAIPLTDKGMAAADKKIAAMPADSARKEALDFKWAQHAEYDRKHGFTK